MPSFSESSGYEAAWQSAYGHGNDPVRELLIYPLLEKEIGSLRGERIIDIGCGNGWLALRLSHLEFAQAHCIDKSQRFLEYARKTVRDQRVSFVIGDASKALPFGQAVFDRAFSIFVTNELESINSYFAEIFRVLKDSGRVHIVMLHPFILLHAQMYKACTGKNPSKISGYLDYKSKERFGYLLSSANVETPFYQYTFEDLTDAVAKSGLFLEKLLELRTDSATFQAYEQYWRDRWIPKFLYLGLLKKEGRLSYL